MRCTLLIALTCCLVSNQAIAQLAEDTDSDRVSGVTQRPAGDDEPRDFSAVVQQVIQQTEAFRAEHGVGELSINEQLTDTSAYFAQYMARTGDYGHTADGKRPSERAKAHGYDYCLVSENIAHVYSSRPLSDDELAQRFFEGWKESPEHRENMLDAAVTEIGVAIGQSPETGYIFAVQMFGRPESEAIRFEVANRTQQLLRYQLGERILELPPGYTRIHKRCRTSELQFMSGEDEEPLETVQPQSGDQLTLVSGPQGGVEIQRQHAETQPSRD